MKTMRQVSRLSIISLIGRVLMGFHKIATYKHATKAQDFLRHTLGQFCYEVFQNTNNFGNIKNKRVNFFILFL